MIFIHGEKKGNLMLVVLRHYSPQEVEKADPNFYASGYVVESVPDAPYKLGMYADTYYNTDNGEFVFEYFPAPKTEEEMVNERFAALQKDNADMKAAIVDLTMTIQFMLMEGGEQT